MSWEADWDATPSPHDASVVEPPPKKPRYSRPRLYRGMPEQNPKKAAADGFGATLRALRLAHNLSQESLAEDAGVNHSSVARWELGGRRPTRDSAERLAKVLGDGILVAGGFLPSGWIAIKADAA